MKFNDAKYFGIKLSPHRIKNDKGQLIVTGCEFARTGKQKYHTSELGIKDKDEFIYLDRPVKEVSDSKTVASFEGAPVTLDHPKDDVKVGVNWDKLAKGFATNVKYVADSDTEGHLQADFIFTDADLIKMIENNEISELSAGYNCDVDEDTWVQSHIRGNHIAVVQQARAGHQARLLDKKYESPSKKIKTVKIGDKEVKVVSTYTYELKDSKGNKVRCTDCYGETASGKKKFLCTVKDMISEEEFEKIQDDLNPIFEKRQAIDDKLRSLFSDPCFEVEGFMNGNDSSEGSIYVVDYNPYKDKACKKQIREDEDVYSIEDLDTEDFLELASDYIETKITPMLEKVEGFESLDVGITDWSGEEEYPIDFHIYCEGVTK